MRRGAELLREQNVLNFDGLLKIALAEAETGRAISTAQSRSSTKRWRRATAWAIARSKQNCIVRAAKSCSSADPSNPAPAEEAFQTAIAVAREQGHAQLRIARGSIAGETLSVDARPADAYAVLTPALEGFSATPEMREIAEAQALFAALAETRGGQGRGRAATAAAASADGLR